MDTSILFNEINGSMQVVALFPSGLIARKSENSLNMLYTVGVKVRSAQATSLRTNPRKSR